MHVKQTISTLHPPRSGHIIITMLLTQLKLIPTVNNKMLGATALGNAHEKYDCIVHLIVTYFPAQHSNFHFHDCVLPL